MKITVFGSGYVGLVTGACLADVGHSVMCIDIDERKIDGLNNGIVPIYEPGLDELILKNRKAGRLLFSTDASEGVCHGHLQFIAVGTPPDEDGKADLKYVLEVASSIGQHMAEPKIIIDKSTVPVGTADKVRDRIGDVLSERGLSIDFDVCSNPEFLKEGAAIEDFTKGARIVVGTDSSAVRDAMRHCYAPYNRNHDKMIFMDVRSAELTKYAANAMLATKISFMNEMANLAELLEADIEQVRLGIGSDPRIGYHFIYPGCGYGGSCFPKDVQALSRTAQDVGYQADLLEAVESVNNRQKHMLFKKLQEAFAGDVKGKRVAVWGLAFKPNTDDMRDAPSRAFIEAAWEQGVHIQAHDPEAMGECARIYGQRDDLTLCASHEAALQGADALVICTEWKAYRAFDMDRIRETLRFPLVIDGRNLFDPVEMTQSGLLYYGVGRGSRKE